MMTSAAVFKHFKDKEQAWMSGTGEGVRGNKSWGGCKGDEKSGESRQGKARLT